MEKLLSISIAAYNIEKFIEKTLTSCIVAEKYQKDLEVIVVNDGSSDSTLKIASKYADKYPNLFKIINKRNGGYGSTINAAISLASGKYFRLLDGDDWYDTKELENFLVKIKKVDVDLILNNFTICYDKTGKKNRVNLLLENEGEVCDIEKLILKNNIAMYSFCYRTELLKQYNIYITEKCFYTDVEYMVYPLIHVKNYVYFNNNIYQYRIGVQGQSVSLKGMKKNYKDASRVMNNILITNVNSNISKNVKEIIEVLSAMMVKMSLKCDMSLGVSNLNRKKVLEKDRMIKTLYYEVYMQTNTPVFKILRMSNYWIYPIWVVSMKIKEKFNGKI